LRENKDRDRNSFLQEDTKQNSRLAANGRGNKQQQRKKTIALISGINKIKKSQK
jgi:hypothetical protein